MSKSVFEIRDELVEHIGILEQYTKKLGAGLISANLKQMKLRYSHGLVRIVFMGGTNAGKSTTINAILKKIIVPENPNTSSPVPVWIGYTPQNEKIEVVFKKENSESDVEIKKFGPKDFRREFCYNHEEQSDFNRERFKNVKWASVMTNSDLLKEGITIIDSLGTKANDIDSIKALEIIDDGIDAVFYLINSTNGLQLDDIVFIREKLFGYGDRMVINPVIPKNFILVVNKFNDVPIGATIQGITNKLKELFKKKNNEFDVEGYNIVKQNIITINSRTGRLDSCGYFPYVENAPLGSDFTYIKNAEELEKMEKLRLDKLDEADIKDANLNEIKQKIYKLSCELFIGENSVVEKRLNELINICKLIIKAAENRLEKSDEKLAHIKRILNKVVEIKDFFGREEDRLKTDIEGFETNLIDAISTIMNIANVSEFGGLINGFVNEYDAIPGNLPQYSDYKNSLDNGNAACFDLIRPVVEPVVIECLSKLGRKIVTDLWEYESSSISFRAPKFLVEDVRKYLHNQRTTFIGKIRELKNENIENIGIIIPDDDSIKKYCENLVSLAETGILYSFNSYSEVSKWSENCKNYLKSVKPGFWGWVFSGFKSNITQEKFWQEIKNKIILPTIVDIFNKTFLKGNEYIANDRPIRNAFTYIIRNFNTLFDKSIIQIENEINKIQSNFFDTSSRHEVVQEEMQSIIKNTASFKEDIEKGRDTITRVA